MGDPGTRHGGPDDLTAALTELGERLALPGAADPVAAAVTRIRTAATVGGPPTIAPPRLLRLRRRVLLAAAAVVLLAAVVWAIPGSRRAVARWLGIGSVTVTFTEEIPEAAGRTYELGAPVPLADAVATAERAGWTLRAPPSAGRPGRAFVGQPAESVTLAWTPTADLPAIEGSRLGLVLTVMPGTTDAGGMSKQASHGTTIELLRVADGPAYWISGRPHEVVITDSDGDMVHDTSRLAGNTLVWTEGDLTYRLESSLERDEAVALAASLEPLPG
jgi:hypothetical protein